MTEPTTAWIYPSLGCTSVEVLPSRLFRDPKSVPLYLYVLQQEISQSMDRDSGINYALMKTPDFPTKAIDDLGSALGIADRIIELAGDIRRHRSSISLRPGSHVLLCTPAVISGYTARSALQRIAKAGLVPWGVATLADLRSEPLQPLSIYGWSANVWSVDRQPVQIQLDRALGASSAHLIDSTSRVGLIPVPLLRKQRLSTSSFLEECAKSNGSVLIGHFARSADRHLTTYLNIATLLNDSPLLVSALIEAVDEWLLGTPTGSQTTIYFPDDDVQFAAKAAELIVKEYQRRGRRIRSTPMRRVLREGDMGFEELPAVDFEAGPCIFIDWGAVTTRTVRRSLAVMADRGHSRIKALLITSQLTPLAEDELVRTDSIVGRHHRQQTPQLALDGVSVAPEIDVLESQSVSCESLVSLPLAMGSRESCSACRITDELRLLLPDAPSHLLYEHILFRLDEFQPRTVPAQVDELRSSGRRTVFGFLISPATAAELIRIRTDLASSVESTGLAVAIRSEILGLPNAPRTVQHAWLLLLAVDPEWVHCIPVDLAECRRAIARVCLATLRDQGGRTGEARLAVVVLRSVRKNMLVEWLPTLLGAWWADLRVTGELLLAAWSFLVRPYHHQPQLLGQFVRAIGESIELLSESVGAKEPALSLILEELASLRSVGESHLVSSGARSLSAMDAVDELKRRYEKPMTRHARVTRSVLIVDDALNGPIADDALASGDWVIEEFGLAGALQAWDDCSTFIARNVLPYMATILAVGEGEGYRSEVFARLDVASLFRLKRDLQRLHLRASAPSAAMWLNLRSQFAAWYDFALLPPERNPKSGLLSVGASLYRLLSGVPARLGDSVEAGVDGAKRLSFIPILNAVDANKSAVFCAGRLLEEVVTHLILNAAGPQHSLDGRPEEGPTIQFQVRESDGVLELEIRNNWSTVTPARGAGLESFEQRLAGFGAGLKASPLTPRFVGDWSWIATISLQKWSGSVR